MNFLGDFFALGLVIVLSMFYFNEMFSLTKTSKLYVFSLIATAATALTNLMTGVLLNRPDLPLWMHMTANSLYFCVNLLATSSIGLYLFVRILEHSHQRHCMRNAIIGLASIYGVYLVFVIANLWNGCLFYFDGQMQYHRGPLNGLGYLLTLCQMALVIVCFIRNRKNASLSMRRVLLQTFPVVVLCIVIQRKYPQIMLNSFIMSMVMTVLFLTYNGQRDGIHNLTKLNDRHRFFETIDARIKTGSRFQVFLINLKNYGAINKKYGHVFGDEVLYQFAFSLERLIKTGKAFHMNGTVFALVLPYTDQHTAERHLETTLGFVKNGIVCDQIPLNFEYVLVEYIADASETDTETFYEKLEYASARAYQKKDCLIRYTHSMGEEMQRQRYLIERLKHIDTEHGYEVWYQPTLSVADGRYTTMEALVRLREPDGRMISPGEFIPIAEQTGMLRPITWFVVDQVCQLLHENPELRFTTISVNLPMAQLLDTGFLERLNSIVDHYGLEHRCIALEFTERAILDNFEKARCAMRDVRGAGYQFYLDDFGSGYSNFNCLLQLPFSVVKLDGTLIRLDLGEAGERNLGLTQKLISFLHENNTAVVAEGVETDEVAKMLTRIQVDRIQGFYYAKPMAKEHLLHFYRRQFDLEKEREKELENKQQSEQ